MTSNDDDRIPVYVSEKHDTVSVFLLLETPIGLAIVEGDKWEPVGTIHEVTDRGRHERTKVLQQKQVFAWTITEDGTQGSAPTRAKAREALLKELGYREVDANAAIPDMLEGLL